MGQNVPTVELSIAATSDELKILAAAAQRKHMSLKDFLRLQLVIAAKAALRPGPEAESGRQTRRKQGPQGPLDDDLAPQKPAFLP